MSYEGQLADQLFDIKDRQGTFSMSDIHADCPPEHGNEDFTTDAFEARNGMAHTSYPEKHGLDHQSWAEALADPEIAKRTKAGIQACRAAIEEANERDTTS